MKKIVFLAFTLAIPVFLFLFLKLFGTNTFEVPVLFQNGIPGCSGSSTLHTVPEFEFTGETEKSISSVDLKGFLIFGILDVENPESNRDLMVELVRIKDAFYETGSPHFVLFIHGSEEVSPGISGLIAEMGLETDEMSFAFMEPERFQDFLTCGIALADHDTKDFHNLVLVDPERRIRGIYDGLDREKTDQLILELKILKQNS